MRRTIYDDTPSLLIRGYNFGEHIWRRTIAGARAAPMRLLGSDALLVRGVDAVALFYDEGRIARHGAMPKLVQETLFGHGSVHSLDGRAHRHRKATFVDIAYEHAQVARISPLLRQEWQSEIDAWLRGGDRTAYQAAVGAFGRASMRWAGLPGTAAAKTRWSARLAQVVDGFGSPYSPAYLLAYANRLWSDRHARLLIEAVRAGSISPSEDSALHQWAWHRDQDDELLAAKLAGIELQNCIRPMIAVARFVAFAAKELHEQPEWRARIAAETRHRGLTVDGPLAVAFAQETRRSAPFVPMLPGVAKVDIELDGQRLHKGHRLLLDVQGTNTDKRSWQSPDAFRPERFYGITDYEALEAFIPHGGGDVALGHRCPGEKLAIAGLACAISALSDSRLRMLGRGLHVNRHRLPTKPASGVHVRAADSTSQCPFH